MPAAGPTAPARTFGSAAAYCRAARRIRGMHRHQPGRLYRELRALSGSDGGARPAPVAGAPTRIHTAEAFAAEVGRRLDGPVLRHAQRKVLMRLARQTGIEPFEANLIIAAVQHRRTGPGSDDAKRMKSQDGSYLGVAAVAISLQALITCGAWAVFAG